MTTPGDGPASLLELLAAERLEHVTREGERWDQIAARYYGSALAYEPLVRANPTVPLWPVLPAGIRLVVPVLAADVVEVAAEGLPPWKRGSAT